MPSYGQNAGYGLYAKVKPDPPLPAILSHSIAECNTLVRQILSCFSSVDVRDWLDKTRKKRLFRT
ncbi:MAG: hypothetical protein P4L44_13600 [Oryzomonas sp.]|uniref:hypothetical protein n=1 Tax=Oryzomonas sp. TaxID=2855186 RepID=UPI00283B510C|nr:hypothetical protein [Oryzomonas sp.]MDR3580990.1 hypothetical protein [Oryzomonas sp.]